MGLSCNDAFIQVVSIRPERDFCFQFTLKGTCPSCRPEKNQNFENDEIELDIAGSGQKNND